MATGIPICLEVGSEGTGAFVRARFDLRESPFPNPPLEVKNYLNIALQVTHKPLKNMLKALEDGSVKKISDRRRAYKSRLHITWIVK